MQALYIVIFVVAVVAITVGREYIRRRAARDRAAREGSDD
jgi:hypothetical protein